METDASEKKVYGKRLEPTVWLLAWDAYALVRLLHVVLPVPGRTGRSELGS